MESRSRGKGGSEGQVSPHSPSRLGLGKRGNLGVSNDWAGNAFGWREPSTRSSFVQLAGFLFLVGVLVTLLGVNLYASGKLEGLETSPSPPSIVKEMRDNCAEREDMVDYAASSNGARVILSESSPPYHGAILVLPT